MTLLSSRTLSLTEPIYDYLYKVSLREPEPLRRLRARGAQVLALYSEGSTAFDLLTLAVPNARSQRELLGARLHFVDGCDHVFTPLWAQRQLLDAVTNWIDGLPAAAAPPPPQGE